MESQTTQIAVDLRKPYEKPEVRYELPLEIRAGSPIEDGFDPLNPLGLGK
jgi:hypothetical protein